MSETARWLNAVRQVVAAVKSSDITELELANDMFSVRLRREPIHSRTSNTLHAERGLHNVLAPFTGVFYRAATPSARPYASEQDWVDADAVIGLVETMKIFNEVTADVSGRIIEFTVESGQLVHAGDVLVVIEPGERATADSEPHL
jgi:acetyl-CoA carboxylase biotin carboxyl carrier protein